MEVEFHYQALKHQSKPIPAFLFEVIAYEPGEERPRVPQQTGMPVGNGRITIRTMPATGTAATFDDGIRAAPAPETIQTPRPTQTRGIRWRRR